VDLPEPESANPKNSEINHRLGKLMPLNTCALLSFWPDINTDFRHPFSQHRLNYFVGAK